MEQVPNIAMFLHENRPNFPEAFSRYLVPIVVRYLTDPNNQVSFTLKNCLFFESCILGGNDDVFLSNEFTNEFTLSLKDLN